jgi:hypothetical protein
MPLHIVVFQEVEMSLLTTSAASIHQLAAAAAFAGPPPRPSIDALSSGREEGEVVKNWWGKYNAITNILLSAGWMIEQHTLRTKRHLDQETEGAVRTKDVCVVGAMITNVANVIADQMMKHEFPDGVCVTAKGALSPDMPAGVGTYLGFFKVIGMLNRAFVAGAVAATPFINFALFNEYKPHPIRSFFVL